MSTPAEDIGVFARGARRLGFWAPLTIGAAGSLAGLAFAANDVQNQKRGDKLPTLAGHGVALVTRTVSAAALTSGLMMIPGLGPIAAGVVATAAAFYPNAQFDSFAGRGFRALSDVGRRVGRLEMGGRFEDSLSARAARDAAIQQMNGTMVASRRWLGSEAEIYHR
jgi:hypothetical protein